ncbi:MAG: efflux RND transporter periplasmic adaptor subunit [Methylovirgula sp.]
MVKKFLQRTIVVLGLAAIAGSAIWSFVQARSEAKHGDDDDGPVKKSPRVSNAGGVPTITLDAAALDRNVIDTVVLENTLHAQTLRAYGTVLNLQPLTDLTNKYAIAKANIETQQAKRDLAQANVARARALYTQGPHAISKAQLETAEENLRIDAASLGAAQAQFQALSHTALQTWGTALGQGFDQALSRPSSLLMRLIERRDMLIQVTLPADTIVASAPEQAFIEQAAGHRIALRYVSPAAETDPHIQGQSFFYMATAASGLVPGMNIVAYVPTGQRVARAEVPASAIVWVQGRAWAYVRTGPKTLVRREIATDSPAPDGGYFVKNMPNGTRVVISGAQMLLSEEFRTQIQSEE